MNWKLVPVAPDSDHGETTSMSDPSSITSCRERKRPIPIPPSDEYRVKSSAFADFPMPLPVSRTAKKRRRVLGTPLALGSTGCALQMSRTEPAVVKRAAFWQMFSSTCVRSDASQRTSPIGSVSTWNCTPDAN
eukprot:163969-Prymnesium_polylepis.6